MKIQVQTSQIPKTYVVDPIIQNRQNVTLQAKLKEVCQRMMILLFKCD